LSPRHRRIGIIAGEGTLPAAVARAAQERGCDPFIIALSSAPADIENFPHHRVQIGEVGRILRILRREGCTSLVFVGRLRRPNVWRIRVDTGFLRLLPELLPLLKGGDDKVLRGVARFFERRGFEVFGTHQVAPHLLAPAGSFGRVQPSSRDREDMALGLQVLKALGPFDIGQAVAIAHNYVLAVEAAEGTDAMLERCRSLNNWGSASRKGVLVKAPKQGQDLRLDLPAIGPRTVDLAADAGLAGIAVQAGAVLLANSEELVEKADRGGIFLYGVSSGEQPGGE
ncbi:MAG TPA: UDP-2,3-diacylglucosamine diphosphatase LpxI, partial [Hyphomicrobiales bacterium]|nr:UDP-2,3-diacylglucosamine diphosphatase LpxI [Hyphomicrobiales bacterium]